MCFDGFDSLFGLTCPRKVEERLFRVPRDAFESHSQYFRDLFSSKGTTPTGDINEPIYLEGIEVNAFRDILRLLYPPYVHSHTTTTTNGC